MRRRGGLPRPLQMYGCAAQERVACAESHRSGEHEGGYGFGRHGDSGGLERASVNEERGFLQRGSRGRGEIERGPEERGDRRRGGLEGAARHLGELESEARKGARRDAADERGEDDEAAGAPELARQGA